MNALALLGHETLVAHEAASVVPNTAVIESASSILEFVALRTFLAGQEVQLSATFHDAVTTPQSEVRLTVRADAPLVSDAAGLYLTAGVFWSQVKSTITGRASEFVVSHAVGNLAMVIFLAEGLRALLAPMIGFELAAQNFVLEAGVVDEAVVLLAGRANVSRSLA